jgi:hypothetical protein
MSQSPTAVSWSRWHGAECIRLAGIAAGTDPRVAVRPQQSMPGARHDAPAGSSGAQLPAMAGRVVRDEADLCFLPRFGFLDGTAYAVTVNGAQLAVLPRPRPERPATTEVAGIWPTATQVPRNLLRLYVLFSAPMSEGYAARHVHITGDGGERVPGAPLPAEHELWDAARRRLTVLLDPARIKRGLAAHRAVGYPLQPGQPFRLVVDDGFRDSAGARLHAPAQRRYQVGGEERRRVDPAGWRLTAPAAGTTGPLVVGFSRPLDHGLLGRCLRVASADGRTVNGAAQPGPEEMSWQFTPQEEWAPGLYRLLADPVLEDLAGNSVTRVFDRDLATPGGEPPQPGPAAVAFCVSD